MINEIELKYVIEPEKIETFLLLPGLSNLKPSIKHLYSIYYDTFDLYLLKNDYVLRLRKKDDNNYIQTVKRSGKVEQGLHQRPEWEWPVNSIQPNLECFPEQGYLKNLNLIPLFVTEFDRSSWIIDYQDSTIELSLDQGKIYCSNSAEFIPIHEIELELLHGQIKNLLEYGSTLQTTLALQTENINKAEKGFKLIQNILK